MADIAFHLSLVFLGMIVGALVVWMPIRHRPTMHQLKFTSHLHQRKSDEYKTLCQDALTGLDLIGHYVAALQLSSPNENMTKILDSIASLQRTIVERSGESPILTPLHDNPFSMGRDA